MDSSTRWIGIAAVLGLCTAYALWGARPATVPEPAPPDVSKVKEPTETKVPTPPKTAETASALKMNPDKVDFGDVKVPESRSLTVQVENPTSKTINIQDVKGSCGCLKVEMKEKKIEPGKSVPLNLLFNAQNGKRPESYTVTLHTDEDAKSRAKLPIHVKVVQIFLVEPQSIYFEDAVKGVPSTREATITRVDGSPFKIKNIATNHKELSFKWEPVAGSNDSAYKIIITVNSNEPGAFTEGAGIMTDHPTVPAMPLNIGVHVAGEVYSKMQLLMAAQKPDATIEPFVTTIHRAKAQPFEIKSIEESEKRPTQFTQTRQDDGSYKVTITLTGAYTDKLPYGSFLIHTTGEDAPLHVPCRVMRRGAQLLNSGEPEAKPPLRQ